MERQDKKGFMDTAIEKVASRKLLVFGMSTGLLIADKVNADQWVMISLLYIGSQALIDLAINWRRGGSQTSVNNE